MEIRFTKMQGLGNDFVLLDALSSSLALSPAEVRRIADRRYGVGCDQVLLIEPATMEGTDVRYRIFNADGGEVEHCGNGARCVARYLRDEGRVSADRIVLQTVNGSVRMECREDGQVTVDMGPPRFSPGDIPMRVTAEADAYELDVGGERVQLQALSMGNPHAVLRVADVATAPVATLGPRIATHEVFPAGVNVGFMEVVERARIRLRVYERGVGETPACGTGACAAVVAGRLQGLLDAVVDVALPGGHLVIRWDGGGASVWMTGPAERVFEGRIQL
jgi:diaminopimelate epimerase